MDEATASIDMETVSKEKRRNDWWGRGRFSFQVQSQRLYKLVIYNLKLKGYSVIFTTSLYGMNQKI